MRTIHPIYIPSTQDIQHSSDRDEQVASSVQPQALSRHHMRKRRHWYIRLVATKARDTSGFASNGLSPKGPLPIKRPLGVYDPDAPDFTTTDITKPRFSKWVKTTFTDGGLLTIHLPLSALVYTKEPGDRQPARDGTHGTRHARSAGLAMRNFGTGLWGGGSRRGEDGRTDASRSWQSSCD